MHEIKAYVKQFRNNQIDVIETNNTFTQKLTHMVPYPFYIQQTHFDGQSYTKGSVVDTYSEFGCACKEFAELSFSEAKQPTTRNWPGDDGLEVYVPDVARLKEFDVDAEFIIVGDASMSDEAGTSDAQRRRRSFLQFLYGRNAGAVGSRLAIFDAHSNLGYKDVTVKKVSPVESHRQEYGNVALYVFRVTFSVYDPVTEVTPLFNNGVITSLDW